MTNDKRPAYSWQSCFSGKMQKGTAAAGTTFCMDADLALFSRFSVGTYELEYSSLLKVLACFQSSSVVCVYPRILLTSRVQRE